MSKSDDKLDPVSIATWARLRSAGRSPIGGKPYGAEVYKPEKKKKKVRKPKKEG